MWGRKKKDPATPAEAKGSVAEKESGSGGHHGKGGGKAVLTTRGKGVKFRDVYELDERLRSGSYGTVYTCHLKKEPKTVYAVKDIDRSKIKPKQGESLFREIEIMRELRHIDQYIVGLVDFFEEPEKLYMVLVYAAGGDVFDRLTERTVYTEKNARDLGRTLLKAIEAMHSVKPYPIAHRDLKPENLLLKDPNDDTSILLADFGFARRVHEGNYCTTRCGTPSYVAPEILVGTPYGISVDLWSTGCLLYMLIGGTPPFQAENHRELFRKIRAADFVFYDAYFGKVSLEAKQLIGSHLLTVDPHARFTATQALQESDWFKTAAVDTDLSQSIEEFKKFKARKQWKVAAKAIGFAATARFWNPDAVSFEQQVQVWDQKVLEEQQQKQEAANKATDPFSSLFFSQPKETSLPPLRKVQPVHFHDVYDLKTKLRKGSFATVWECVHKPTQDVFAVKIIDRRGLTPKDDEAVMNEVAMMQCLVGNKYVVQLMDFYEEHDHFFMVMEYLSGGDVFDRIVDMTHYTEKDARDLSVQLLKAVASMHKAGIAHRDIKPQNLLLRSKDNNAAIKVTDFGFARRVHTPLSLTNRVGTPTYVAPEILKNVPHDQRVDLWSIGVVIYVLLVGYPPFLEDDQATLFLKIRTGEWQFFEEDWCHISQEAKDLIRGLLVTDPKLRWSLEEALRSDWIQQDPHRLSNVSLSQSVQALKTKKKSLRQLARAYMFIDNSNKKKDENENGVPKAVDVGTQAQDLAHEFSEKMKVAVELP